MTTAKQVLGPDDVRRAVTRIAHEIIERNQGLAGVALVGLQRGGVWLAEELGTRIAEIDQASTDFSYCVSITGVTGAAGAAGDTTVEFLERAARHAQKPFVVGFGVKSGADIPPGTTAFRVFPDTKPPASFSMRSLSEYPSGTSKTPGLFSAPEMENSFVPGLFSVPNFRYFSGPLLKIQGMLQS